MKNNKIEVVQNPENKVPAKVLAQEIVNIGQAMKHLTGAKLKREAIVTLVKDRTGIHKTVIERVLSSLENLERDWLK